MEPTSSFVPRTAPTTTEPRPAPAVDPTVPVLYTPAALAGVEVSYTDATRFGVLGEEYRRLEANGDPGDDEALTQEEAELLARQCADSRNAAVRAVNADKSRTAFAEQLKLSKEGYFEDLKAYYEQGGTSEPFMVAFEDSPVLYSASRNQKYVQLPESFLKLPRYQNLPSEQQAVVECMNYLDRAKRSYIPLPPHAGQQVIGLFQTGFEGNIGVLREGPVLWLYPALGYDVPDATVLVKVVIRSRDETILPLPGLLAAASDMEILSMMWNLRKGRGKQDKHNDSNPQV